MKKGVNKMRIILASKSPRRKELLELMGIKKFEVIVSDAEETIEEGLTIQEQSKKIAYSKAKAVFDETKGNRIVIGADTLVIKDNKLYGKPHTKEDAFDMLKKLQGTKHQGITSLCVLKEEDGKYTEYLNHDVTNVELKPISDAEIETWIKSGHAMDKAGAYSIQEEFAVHVKGIEGSYHTGIGLSISQLYDVIKEYI